MPSPCPSNSIDSKLERVGAVRDQCDMPVAAPRRELASECLVLGATDEARRLRDRLHRAVELRPIALILRLQVDQRDWLRRFTLEFSVPRNSYCTSQQAARLSIADLDDFAGRHRFIDGDDEFQRAPSLQAIDQGGRAVHHRIDDMLQIGDMAEAIDARRDCR